MANKIDTPLSDKKFRQIAGGAKSIPEIAKFTKDHLAMDQSSDFYKGFIAGAEMVARGVQWGDPVPSVQIAQVIASEAISRGIVVLEEEPKKNDLIDSLSKALGPGFVVKSVNVDDIFDGKSQHEQPKPNESSIFVQDKEDMIQKALTDPLDPILVKFGTSMGMSVEDSETMVLADRAKRLGIPAEEFLARVGRTPISDEKLKEYSASITTEAFSKAFNDAMFEAVTQSLFK